MSLEDWPVEVGVDAAPVLVTVAVDVAGTCPAGVSVGPVTAESVGATVGIPLLDELDGMLFAVLDAAESFPESSVVLVGIAPAGGEVLSVSESSPSESPLGKDTAADTVAVP